MATRAEYLRSRISTVPRIEARWVEKTSACWNWRGKRYASGYGKATINGRSVLTHRAFFEHYRGAIPAGKQLDHLCRNRACCNPEHLEVVSARENVVRGFSSAGINARKTHCCHGHALVGNNVYVPPKRPGRRYCRACAAARQIQRRN